MNKVFYRLLIITSLSAEIYDISIPENDTATYNYAEFRIRINEDINTVRGIYWFMHPNNGDSRNIVTDSAYLALVDSQHFALMGARIFNMHMQTGIGDATIKAIDSIAILSNHNELSIIPFFINGYSWGGQFAYHFANWIPERIIGIITQKGGYHNTEFAENLIQIPILMFVGENDLQYRIDNLTSIFLNHRPLGAKWALAVEQNTGHSQINDHTYLNLFFHSIVNMRIPDIINPFEPIILNNLSDSSAWFGNQISWNIGSSQCYDDNIDSSSWFPNRIIGEKWQSFVSDDSILDTSLCDDQMGSINIITPDNIILNNPYPNPFNPSTTISFNVLFETIETINIFIYSIDGKIINKKDYMHLKKGEHQLHWNAQECPSGIYFIKLLYENKKFVKKVVLLK